MINRTTYQDGTDGQFQRLGLSHSFQNYYTSTMRSQSARVNRRVFMVDFPKEIVKTEKYCMGKEFNLLPQEIRVEPLYSIPPSKFHNRNFGRKRKHRSPHGSYAKTSSQCEHAVTDPNEEVEPESVNGNDKQMPKDDYEKEEDNENDEEIVIIEEVTIDNETQVHKGNSALKGKDKGNDSKDLLSQSQLQFNQKRMSVIEENSDEEVKTKRLEEENNEMMIGMNKQLENKDKSHAVGYGKETQSKVETIDNDQDDHESYTTTHDENIYVKSQERNKKKYQPSDDGKNDPQLKSQMKTQIISKVITQSKGKTHKDNEQANDDNRKVIINKDNKGEDGAEEEITINKKTVYYKQVKPMSQNEETRPLQYEKTNIIKVEENPDTYNKSNLQGKTFLQKKSNNENQSNINNTQEKDNNTPALTKAQTSINTKESIEAEETNLPIQQKELRQSPYHKRMNSKSSNNISPQQENYDYPIILPHKTQHKTIINKGTISKDNETLVQTSPQAIKYSSNTNPHKNYSEMHRNSLDDLSPSQREAVQALEQKGGKVPLTLSNNRNEKKLTPLIEEKSSEEVSPVKAINQKRRNLSKNSQGFQFEQEIFEDSLEINNHDSVLSNQFMKPQPSHDIAIQPESIVLIEVGNKDKEQKDIEVKDKEELPKLLMKKGHSKYFYKTKAGNEDNREEEEIEVNVDEKAPKIIMRKGQSKNYYKNDHDNDEKKIERNNQPDCFPETREMNIQEYEEDVAQIEPMSINNDYYNNCSNNQYHRNNTVSDKMIAVKQINKAININNYQQDKVMEKDIEKEIEKNVISRKHFSKSMTSYPQRTNYITSLSNQPETNIIIHDQDNLMHIPSSNQRMFMNKPNYNNIPNTTNQDNNTSLEHKTKALFNEISFKRNQSNNDNTYTSSSIQSNDNTQKVFKSSTKLTKKTMSLVQPSPTEQREELTNSKNLLSKYINKRPNETNQQMTKESHYNTDNDFKLDNPFDNKQYQHHTFYPEGNDQRLHKATKYERPNINQFHNLHDNDYERQHEGIDELLSSSSKLYQSTHDINNLINKYYQPLMTNEQYSSKMYSNNRTKMNDYLGVPMLSYKKDHEKQQPEEMLTNQETQTQEQFYTSSKSQTCPCSSRNEQQLNKDSEKVRDVTKENTTQTETGCLHALTFNKDRLKDYCTMKKKPDNLKIFLPQNHLSASVGNTNRSSIVNDPQQDGLIHSYSKYYDSKSNQESLYIYSHGANDIGDKDKDNSRPFSTDSKIQMNTIDSYTYNPYNQHRNTYHTHDNNHKTHNHYHDHCLKNPYNSNDNTIDILYNEIPEISKAISYDRFLNKHNRPKCNNKNLSMTANNFYHIPINNEEEEHNREINPYTQSFSQHFNKPQLIDNSKYNRFLSPPNRTGMNTLTYEIVTPQSDQGMKRESSCNCNHIKSQPQPYPRPQTDSHPTSIQAKPQPKAINPVNKRTDSFKCTILNSNKDNKIKKVIIHCSPTDFHYKTTKHLHDNIKEPELMKTQVIKRPNKWNSSSNSQTITDKELLKSLMIHTQTSTKPTDRSSAQNSKRVMEYALKSTTSKGLIFKNNMNMTKSKAAQQSIGTKGFCDINQPQYASMFLKGNKQGITQLGKKPLIKPMK